MIKHYGISSLLIILYVFCAILFYGSSFTTLAQIVGVLTAIVFFIEVILVIKIKLISNIKKYFYPSLIITILSFFSLLHLQGAESKFLTLVQVNVLSFILIYKTISDPKVFKQILFSYVAALFIGSLFSFGEIDLERDGGVFGSAVNLYGTAINLGTLFSCFLLLDYFSSTNSSKLSRLNFFCMYHFYYVHSCFLLKKFFLILDQKKR